MLIALAVAAALVVLFVIVVYNGLVRLRLQTQNAWSDIDVQLKRRHDLVPPLSLQLLPGRGQLLPLVLSLLFQLLLRRERPVLRLQLEHLLSVEPGPS